MLSQDNSANFSGESKVQGSFPGSLFFENTCKNFQSNLAVLAVLVIESKGLYWLLRWDLCRFYGGLNEGKVYYT